MTGLGIIQKYDYEEGEELTRSDFSLLAVRTMNKAEEALYYMDDKFFDVSAEDDNAAEFYYLDSMDVMVGDGKGYFHPYDKLKMQDAVKAVVSMLSRRKVIRTRLKRHNFDIFRLVVFERRQPFGILRTKIYSKFCPF